MQRAPETKRDFFISRTGADKDWALWISQELEAAGYTTFLQDRDILPGQSFVERMKYGAEWDCTILVMSPEYWEATFTQPEWQAAFRRGRFLPIRVKRCEIPSLLAHYVYVDLVDKKRDEARQLLLEGVKHQRLNRQAEYPGESGEPKISVARLPAVNPLLVGREVELKQLDDAWPNAAIRLVSITAFGGVGKTSLAINWWHQNQVPGAKRVLGWSFYSQGAAEDRQASADPFLDYALREWFAVTNPSTDSWARGEKLAELIRRERTLLILDGLEPLQFPPGPQTGRLKDPGMVALLKELAAHNPGLCVCTSRLPLADLEDYGNAGLLSIDLDNLTPESGGEYLKQLGVEGSEEELRQASVDFDNHALALTLLGNLLVMRHSHVSKRDTIPSLFDEPKRGGQARRILRQYEDLFKGKPELDVLRIMGLFDRPADKGALKILRKLAKDRWVAALHNLAEARLLGYQDPDGPLDCHPLVREHFAEEYRASKPRAFREAHTRLYEHYSKQAPHRPGKLKAMTSLFYAVYHGCQAGRQVKALNEVYLDRIQRRGAFLTNSLGAYGIDLSLLSNFFAIPWTTPVAALSARDQSWVTAEAGRALRGLGRLRETLEMTTAVAEANLQGKDWANAATTLANISRLHLALGNVREAISAARRSVEVADRSGEPFLRLSERTTLADAFHRAGRLAAAASLFRKAEMMQAEWQPKSPILSSDQGYRYCDLLLAKGQAGEVLSRASQTLKATPKRRPLLDIALDHLSLGRAYPPGSRNAANHLKKAVNGLRAAGRADYLPLGLLARASHFRHTHDFEKAQHDLDEVQILSTRCGMRLHLADSHLEQARFFLAQQRPVDARPHYESAKQLVQETGYHRRDPELVELKTQLNESVKKSGVRGLIR
jgi:tetratricopeptide (TPR) repeat protein